MYKETEYGRKGGPVGSDVTGQVTARSSPSLALLPWKQAVGYLLMESMGELSGIPCV